MRQMSDEGRREIAKELREQFNCCQYAEEFTEGLYDVLDLGHCEPTHGGYPDLAERLADYVEPAPVTGSTSDGYHTFDELYHHRAVLFSVIVAMFRGLSWKSLHHHDGTMYDGMFIVGIDTPAGPATYHYDVEPYWDMFPCRVLDRGDCGRFLGPLRGPSQRGAKLGRRAATERIGTLRDLLQAEVKEEGSEK